MAWWTTIWNGIQALLGAVVSFFYGLIPNLGVAIILLTIAVSVVLFPLTLKQTRSMKAMQELQPEVKRLQKELGHDKPALQKATMDLYKERKVNPAAGCLPILLQAPIWFALYRVLYSFAGADPTHWVLQNSRLAQDMLSGGTGWNSFLWMRLDWSPRHAWGTQGFVGSIPYLVAILLVMASGYYQQVQMMNRTKKKGQDQPKQPGQNLMKFFPVFLGFISFSFPAGLVIYWVASQVFRIGQQSLILWMGDREDARKLREAPVVVPVMEPVKPAIAPNPGPARALRGSGSASKAAAASAARSPQASKKRGKKRKRR